MYCINCGKQIEEGTLCPECAEQRTNETVKPTEAPVVQNEKAMPEPQNRMYGFGKALAALFTGVGGVIISYLTVIFAALIPTAYPLFLMGSIALTVLPLIFGISSIKTFINRGRNCSKPVATLVLGIVGISLTFITTMFLILSVIIIGTLTAAY